VSLFLVALGAVALALPGLRPSLSLRGNPRWFAPLDTIALALGATTVVAGLGLSAAVGAMHLATGAALARYEGHLAPGGLAASIAAGVVLAIAARNAARAAWRARRATRIARAEAWVGRHHAFGDHEVVVLPTSALVAYSVDGSPPQVVVSQGWEARGADMAAFVVDHERAHLRRGHRRFLLVAATADAAFGFVPMVRRSTLALMMAVERAADETAAGPDRHRRHRLAAAMRDLAATSGRTIPAEAVTYRAAGLGASPPRTSRPELVAVGGLLALGVAVAGASVHIGVDVPAIVASLR